MARVDLDLNGRRVQSVLIENSVVFELSGHSFMMIQSAIRFERGTDAMTLSAEDDPDQALQPIRELVGSTIDEATVDAAGALRVDFSTEHAWMWNLTTPMRRGTCRGRTAR